MKALHPSGRLLRAIGFAAGLLLAACSTDVATPEPNVQGTDFTVFVLATSEVGADTNTIQATPWTLERGAGEDVQGQGQAVGEAPLIRERVHTMQVSAEPGDEMTLNVTTGAGETVDVGPFSLFGGAEPADGEVLSQGNLTVVAKPNSAETAALKTATIETATVQPIAFSDIKLSGDAEVPPVETDASGEAALLLIDNLLFAVGRFAGLQGELFEVQGSPAHIHQGAADENGDIVFNLAAAANEDGDGFFVGLGSLEEEEVERLGAGELYINIHSTFSESGELRGQITSGERVEQPDEDDEDEAGALTLNVAESNEFGEYIADGEGNSLYLFTNDTRGAGESTCNGECAETWPALTIDPDEETLEVGDGLDADLLGSLEREDGTIQVAYNGWPLYRFSGDEAAGDTNGQGVGDTWFLVNPDGSRNVPDDEPDEDEGDEAGVQLETREKDPFGAYITDSEGNSLYLFFNDGKRSSQSNCNNECAETWPPLTLSEGETVTVAEGSGLDADLLSSFERKDGMTQVTYNGWPLYRFSGDDAPGDTDGTEVNLWFLVTPDGDENLPDEAGGNSNDSVAEQRGD